MKHIITFLFVFVFWFVIAVKVAGTSFATWSWWWCLPGLCWVPFLSLAVKHFGL